MPVCPCRPRMMQHMWIAVGPKSVKWCRSWQCRFAVIRGAPCYVFNGHRRQSYAHGRPWPACHQGRACGGLRREGVERSATSAAGSDAAAAAVLGAAVPGKPKIAWAGGAVHARQAEAALSGAGARGAQPAAAVCKARDARLAAGDAASSGLAGSASTACRVQTEARALPPSTLEAVVHGDSGPRSGQPAGRRPG